MNYQETCEYLYNQMPMFERQGASGYKEGLSNTLALDDHLGHPHQAFATIHVAGTNGKGSCSHTLAAILQECGYRVGLYTSPHLVDFRERIRVNGIPVNENYVVDFVKEHRAFFEPLHPSFFEVTTALAFSYFRHSHVDIAIIEVGLGGRLDCTNIITPLLSVITNISFDHMAFLGDTLAKIATEKAGIIKKGIPVVIGETTPETRPVFQTKADEVGAVIFAEDAPEVLSADMTDDGGMLYSTVRYGELKGDLGGIYQQHNFNTVLHAVHQLVLQGILCEGTGETNRRKFREELQMAVQSVAKNTGLMGRWQIIRQSPLVVCDTGHNVGGWQYLSRQLALLKCQRLHIIFGMVADKDIDAVLDLLPQTATYYFTQADNHRALPANKLRMTAMAHGLEGEAYPSVNEAVSAVIKCALRNDAVFVGGSSYVVGDFLKMDI